MTRAAVKSMTESSPFATIGEIIAEAKAGRPFIFVDDESRENEGDICVAAEFATPAIINFMIRECGGFVCLALDAAIVDRLALPLQPRRNLIDNQANFTVSIEARRGVSTGVSASDRAVTVKTAIDPASGPDDICTPGHMFPLRAADGGVLARAGHTEACVDVSRLAGLKPAAVICEIMNRDGGMARLPDLLAFARQHDLKIATIEALIAYRRLES
jgi:3,4-dihydroxy 2-butanone 4-phosphate synthase / GTP cyclohydrolase II